MYACAAPLCGYVAKSPFLLRQHARQHTGERPYSCFAGCSASFTSSSALRKHQRIHDKPDATTCPSPHCGFMAASSSAMVRHTRQQGHGSSVVCPYATLCQQRFISRVTLRVHLDSPAHSGVDGAPECRPCGATFASVELYLLHVREHRVDRLRNAGKQGTDLQLAPM